MIFNTYPLESLTVEQAKELQFRMIECITRNFTGKEILNRGDLGVSLGINMPHTTQQAEKAISDFFAVESAILVRGAGTGAIRCAMISCLNPSDTVLIHDAPVYPTTGVTIKSMGLNTVCVDFNKIEDIKEKLHCNPQISAVIIQHTRQKIDDRYSLEQVIRCIKDEKPELTVIVDDNYAVMKTPQIGVQCGADLSAFSAFKLLGPEGIGCIIGKKEFIDKIRAMNYSGGGQVQGHEALDALSGMIYAPVSLAIQAEVIQEVFEYINSGNIKGVKKAYIANAQSKVLLVEFYEDIAAKILVLAQELGAIPNPVGSESKYEFCPLFYRISGTFRQADPLLEKRMIRINPMRSGAKTIIRILEQSVSSVMSVR